VKTPRYFTRTLLAGASADIHAQGHYVKILAVNVGTIRMGIDDESPEQIVPGLQVRVPTGLRHVSLVNVGLVASTVQLYVADEPVDVIQTGLEQLTPAGVLTIVNLTVCQQTGVGATQILAANGLRKWCLVTADLANANNIYLGVANTVTAAADSFFDMMAGGSWREHYTGAVWACSDNGTEGVRAYEST
jgi:hypothetical protein